jgi:hypothetical protein
MAAVVGITGTTGEVTTATMTKRIGAAACAWLRTELERAGAWQQEWLAGIMELPHISAM